MRNWNCLEEQSWNNKTLIVVFSITMSATVTVLGKGPLRRDGKIAFTERDVNRERYVDDIATGAITVTPGDYDGDGRMEGKRVRHDNGTCHCRKHVRRVGRYAGPSAFIY